MGEFRIILNIGIVYMKKIGIFVIGLLAANTVFAQSSPLSYDYVEANLGTGDFYDEDFSFYGAGISYSLNESIYLRGSYSDGATDDDVYFGIGLGESKVEISGYEIGLGFHTPVSQLIDFVVSGSYISSELEIFGFSQDEDGYSVDAGFRFKPIEQVELDIFADFVDVNGENDTGYSASAYYFFTPTFSLGGVYTGTDASNRSDDLSTIAASVRFHF